MVDFFLLLQLAGTGDELQGIKRGIMEMADGIAINKCDGSNTEKAMLAKSQFQNALHLFPKSDSGWIPTVIPCSSIELNGIDELWDMVQQFVSYTKTNGYFEHHRNQQARYWMYETINEQLRTKFYHDPVIQELIKTMEQKVITNELSSFIAAKHLLDEYSTHTKSR